MPPPPPERWNRFLVRAFWLRARARALRERALRRLSPGRMRFVPYSWPLLPHECPCDVHLCDYLGARRIEGKAIFHFGTGGHHVVGTRNHEARWKNEILGITASPSEHSRYLARVVRNPDLATRYKVIFCDIYDLSAALLPMFDVVTLFHLCEFTPPEGRSRRLDDRGVLDLLLRRTTPGGRVLFYAGSWAAGPAMAIVGQEVAAGRLSFEERFETLLVYRRTDTE